MYVVKHNHHHMDKDFDWDTYFSRIKTKKAEMFELTKEREVLSSVREHLKQNNLKMTFVLSKLLRKLLSNLVLPKNIRILELGAATGFLSRWILNQYGGSAVLIDKNESSYRAFNSINDDQKSNITYLIEDMFTVEINETFDIVCSFGLIEHFRTKKDVISIHKKFLKPNGLIIILVPFDSILTRVFLEVFHELNLGYRELLGEKEFRQIMNENNLKTIQTEISQGYSFDFLGGICCAEE